MRALPIASAPLIAFQQFTSGPNKEAFHRYLADFDAVDREAELFDALYDCTDILPKRYAELLFLPPGSTYRDAVRLLLSSWNSALRAPDEHFFD
jgi:hypothetical protein